MKNRFIVSLILLCTLANPNGSTAQITNPEKVKLDDGSHLHYVARGDGEPVIFVHGFLDEFSAWLRQVEGFSREGFKAITYSRRHNFPNRNSIRSNHSAALEADDLAQLVKKLDLKKVHVVGFSYGGYTSLMFALKYPELAKSVTLIEPPIVPWLQSLPTKQLDDGKAHFGKLMQHGVKAAQSAIKAKDEESAIRCMIDAIGGKGKYESLPRFVKTKSLRNVKELKAFLASENRFPPVDRKRVEKLKVPTLILSGSKSVATARLTDPELERLIPKPHRKRVVFEGATHVLQIEQPVRFRETVIKFIREDARN